MILKCPCAQFMKHQGNYAFCIRHHFHPSSFCPDFLCDTSRILPLLHNLYHFIVRFSTSGKRKRIFWVKTWSRKINKPLWLLRQVSQNCTKKYNCTYICANTTISVHCRVRIIVWVRMWVCEYWCITQQNRNVFCTNFEYQTRDD